MPQNEALKTREQAEEKDTWKLEDLYSSDQEWENEYKNTKALADSVKKYKGTLNNGSQNLLNALEDIFAISEKTEKLYVYAHMRRDQDNGNSKYQALTDRAMALSVEFDAATSFMLPELTEIGQKLLTMADEDAAFNKYTHLFNNIIRQKEHILDEKSEELLAKMGEVADSPRTIYSMLNNADIKFGNVKLEDGSEVTISHGRYIMLMENKNRDIRKNTFETYYKSYDELKNTYAATLNSSVKKDAFFAKARNFDSAMEAALFEDNVPTEVYENLLSVIHDNIEALHEYLNVKKQALSLDEMHMYDIYTPLSNGAKFEYTYEQAKELVIKALSCLGEEYVSILKKGFENRWIDVYENVGKTNGAYSWGAYDTHPYVLLNYQTTLDNVFTIAHEMGHSMHSYFSNKANPYVTAGYKIFVAEVASTVNEILLTRYLLSVTEEKDKRFVILNHLLEQYRTTVFRQAMFAEFEKIIHNKAANGESLTLEEIQNVYYDLNKFYQGEDVVVDDQIKMEWARISHFYNSFYVYKYSTGFLSAIKIADGITNKKEGALEKYLEFLHSGGSDYPIELLKIAGVDLTKKESLTDTLNTFKDVLNEFKNLI